MENDFLLLFDGENSTGFYDYSKDKMLANNLINNKQSNAIKNRQEQKLKAIIQQHNNRLIENQLSISNIK